MPELSDLFLLAQVAAERMKRRLSGAVRIAMSSDKNRAYLNVVPDDTDATWRIILTADCRVRAVCLQGPVSQRSFLFNGRLSMESIDEAVEIVARAASAWLRSSTGS